MSVRFIGFLDHLNDLLVVDGRLTPPPFRHQQSSTTADHRSDC